MSYGEPVAEASDSAALRRPAIADAAIAIIAEEGLRALTHRAVDRRLLLPDGSTSYYVRTRRQLLELVVRRLAGRTSDDLESAPGPPPMEPATSPSIEAVAGAVASLLERIAGRAADQRARFALAVDLTGDPELHAFITGASPIRAQLLDRARATVTAIGASDVETSARGLLVLVDGLLFDRLAGSGVDSGNRPDAAAVIASYLRGLERVER